MSKMNKHGILLFDAVNLRKSLSVNSSNLTYTVLEDYEDEGVKGACHKEYADHALVFMWQSLSSNFCQTIGCFASKGEVEVNIFKNYKCMKKYYLIRYVSF